MAHSDLRMTGVERTFPEDQIIVSKTDPTGRLTYVNDVQIKVSGYSEDQLLGKQHSIIRSPDMPRCVFKLLWDTVESGKEIFAYVNNRAINGDHYWVFAHVTPSFDSQHKIIGYHSSRRSPKRSALDVIKPLYAQLLAIEQKEVDRKVGLTTSYKAMLDLLAAKGVAYDELVFSL